MIQYLNARHNTKKYAADKYLWNIFDMRKFVADKQYLWNIFVFLSTCVRNSFVRSFSVLHALSSSSLALNIVRM